MISVKNVSYRYGRFPLGAAALHNISFDIAGGEFLAIMGRNASGKSTLARLLNGMYLPTAGRVEVDGLDTGDRSSRQQVRQLVGLMLAGADRQFVSNIVEEDLAFGPENLGLPANQIRQRVDAALEMVSMEEFAKHPPYLLSGGQKARIALAGMLTMSPRYLVLDEPFPYLDAASAWQLTDLLMRWREQEQGTLIVITHDLESARRAERIMVLEDGGVAYNGTPDELLVQGPDSLRQWGIEPLETSLLAESINRNLARPMLKDIQQSEQLVEILCQLS